MGRGTSVLRKSKLQKKTKRSLSNVPPHGGFYAQEKVRGPNSLRAKKKGIKNKVIYQPQQHLSSGRTGLERTNTSPAGACKKKGVLKDQLRDFQLLGRNETGKVRGRKSRGFCRRASNREDERKRSSSTGIASDHLQGNAVDSLGNGASKRSVNLKELENQAKGPGQGPDLRESLSFSGPR